MAPAPVLAEIKGRRLVVRRPAESMEALPVGVGCRHAQGFGDASFSHYALHAPKHACNGPDRILRKPVGESGEE